MSAQGNILRSFQKKLAANTRLNSDDDEVLDQLGFLGPTVSFSTFLRSWLDTETFKRVIEKFKTKIGQNGLDKNREISAIWDQCTFRGPAVLRVVIKAVFESQISTIYQ